VTYGNYNTIATNDYVTGGITDTLAADLAIQLSDQGEGYGRNLYNGAPVQKTDEFAARTKWLLAPTPDDRLTVALDFEQNHNTVQTAYHAAYGDPTNWGPGLPLPTGQPFLFTGGPWDADDLYPGSYSLKQGGASLNFQHTFDLATFTNITAYRQAQTLYNWSVNPAPSLATLANETESERQFTEEVQLVSPTSSTIKWVGGLFFMHASAAYDPFALSGPDGTPVPLQSVDFDVVEPVYSGAIYGQATAPVPSLRDTNVTLGLRYTVERRDLYGNEVVNFEPTTQIAPIVIPSDAHKIFQKPTWRLAFDHHFTDDLVGYISDNRGFKSGVYNTLPPAATPVHPEVLDAYEIGIKSDFIDHRLRVNAAAFYYNYTNIQVTITQAASTQLVNGAKAQIYGLDLDLEGKVTDNFRVTAGLEVLHDEFKSFPSALFVTPLSVAQGGGSAGTVGSAAGNELPYTPNVTFNISANYAVPISYGNLDFNATYAFTDHWFPTADNISEAPASNLLNARIGWTLRDHRTQVKLWARNLTNQAVPMILLEHANPGGNTEEIDAPPRTYGVTVQYDF
jgi:iron complex outermembrane receptor protein